MRLLNSACAKYSCRRLFWQPANRELTRLHCRAGKNSIVPATKIPTATAQSMNRQLAWERLLDAIERQRREVRAAERAEIEKKRRQNSKRPRGLKERILESKKRRSNVKKLRAKDW